MDMNIGRRLIYWNLENNFIVILNMEYREDADIRLNNIQSRGIILNGDKVLLMFRRKNGNEYYVFPGGHMRKGETPQETAEREIEEETTIKVRNLELVFEFRNYIRKDKEQIDYYFVGEWKSGEPVLSGEEYRRANEDNYYEPMWIDINKVQELTLYSLAAKEWFMEYFERFLESRK